MKKLVLFLMFLLTPAVCFAVQGYPQKGTVVDTTLTTANTEYQVTMPAGTSGFTAQSRTAADFKLATVSNQSGSIYYTVKSGTVYSTPTPLGLGGTTLNTTLFLQSTTGGQIVELLYWQQFNKGDIMQALLKKLNEVVSIAEVRVKKCEEERNQNSSAKSVLDSREAQLNDRDTAITAREKKVKSIEDVVAAQQENAAQAKKNREEARRIKDLEEKLDADYVKKNKELADDKLLLEQQRHKLRKQTEELAEEKKNYRAFAFLYEGYKVNDQANKSGDDNTTYFGFLNRFGEWFIMQQVTSGTTVTWRFVKGNSGYTTAFSAREAQSYDYINVTFK